MTNIKLFAAGCSAGSLNLCALPQAHADAGKITTILDIVFAIAGAIAVLVITIAGFRYVISQGNPQATAQAKNAIIYAAVGLAVTIMAYAIVTFAVNGL